MKYLKKVVIVEAEQFFPNVRPWPEGVEEYHDCTPAGCMSWGLFMMETLEVRFQVRPRDWIITGMGGERYPCRPDIFELTYERVED